MSVFICFNRFFSSHVTRRIASIFQCLRRVSCAIYSVSVGSLYYVNSTLFGMMQSALRPLRDVLCLCHGHGSRLGYTEYNSAYKGIKVVTQHNKTSVSWDWDHDSPLKIGEIFLTEAAFLKVLSIDREYIVSALNCALEGQDACMHFLSIDTVDQLMLQLNKNRQWYMEVSKNMFHKGLYKKTHDINIVKLNIEYRCLQVLRSRLLIYSAEKKMEKTELLLCDLKDELDDLNMEMRDAHSELYRNEFSFTEEELDSLKEWFSSIDQAIS